MTTKSRVRVAAPDSHWRHTHTRYEAPPGYEEEYEEDRRPPPRRPPPPARTRPPARLSLPTVAGAVLGGVIFSGAWLAGAKYTLDGWILGVNLFLTWLHLPASVAINDPWARVVGIVLIGLGYSAVEVVLRPRRNGSIIWAAVWILLIVSDVGSTFLGVISPRDGAWPVSVWLAQTWGAALAWAMILTFGPEQGLVRIWREIR